MQYKNPSSQLGYIPYVLEQHELYVNIPAFMCVFLSTHPVDKNQNHFSLSPSLSLCIASPFLFFPPINGPIT